MRRVAAPAILAVAMLYASQGRAEEVGRAGEAVVAHLEQRGNRYEVTVTPPPDRGVDRRVMEWITDTPGASDDAPDAHPVDVSDYHIRVEKAADASCNGNFEIKSKPVNLAAHKAWVLESASASFISATAFPTKGDVDIRIFVGSNGDVCATSTNKKQSLDHAGCYVKICELLAGFSNFKAEVGNYTTAQATASVVFQVGFVDLP